MQFVSDAEAFSGFLEVYNAYRISGWAELGPQCGDSALLVKIDGSVVAEVRPQHARPDFAGAPLGFALQLQPARTSGKVCTLEVVGAQTGRHIGNSPVVVILADHDMARMVLRGRNDYLFLDKDSNRVLDQLAGRRLLQNEELQEWVEFGKALEHLGRRGIDCFLMAIPNKECVLADYLPPGVDIVPGRPLAQVMGALANSWPQYYQRFSYPLARLRNLAYGPAYSRGDTHWTTLGAWCALEVLLRDAMPEAVERLHAAVLARTLQFQYMHADLLAKLGGSCIELRPLCPLDHDYRCVQDNGVLNTGRQALWQAVSSIQSRRVLLLHDSFGSQLIPYLTRLFGEVHAIWDSVLSLDTIAAIEPELIIFARTERFLIQPSRIVRNPLQQQAPA